MHSVATLLDHNPWHLPGGSETLFYLSIAESQTTRKTYGLETIMFLPTIPWDRICLAQWRKLLSALHCVAWGGPTGAGGSKLFVCLMPCCCLSWGEPKGDSVLAHTAFLQHDGLDVFTWQLRSEGKSETVSPLGPGL